MDFPGRASASVALARRSAATYACDPAYGFAEGVQMILPTRRDYLRQCLVHGRESRRSDARTGSARAGRASRKLSPAAASTNGNHHRQESTRCSHPPGPHHLNRWFQSWMNDPGELILIRRQPGGIAGDDRQTGTTTSALQTDLIVGVSLHAEFALGQRHVDYASCG
jgi:hypothetical protein